MMFCFVAHRRRSPEDIVVRLEDYDHPRYREIYRGQYRDVNIILNNIILNEDLVAYFDDRTGRLCLVPVPKSYIKVPTVEKDGRFYLETVHVV